MAIHLLIKGAMMGFVVAVPVGPLGLLCINRALSLGPWYGLFSGLGIATADALAGGIAALSISLVSQFLVDHQFAFRLVGGLFLCYLGYEIYLHASRTTAAANEENQWASANIRGNPSSDLVQSLDHTVFRCDLCRLECPEHDWPVWRRGAIRRRGLCRFGIVVGGIVSRPNGVSRQI